MSRLFDRVATVLHRWTRPPAAIFAGMDMCIDKAWYLKAYPDVAAKGLDPFTHFYRLGAWEGRRPNRFFDPVWYVQRYPEAAGQIPILHYAVTGRPQGADPGPSFSVAFYYATYPDVAASGFDALDHYIMHGQHERRQINDAIVPSALGTIFASSAVTQDIAPHETIEADNETVLRIALAFAKRDA